NIRNILLKEIDKLLFLLENNNIKDKIKLSFLEFINSSLINYNLKDIFDNEFINKTIDNFNKIINDIYLDTELKDKNNQYKDILYKKIQDIDIYNLFLLNDDKLNI